MHLFQVSEQVPGLFDILNSRIIMQIPVHDNLELCAGLNSVR